MIINIVYTKTPYIHRFNDAAEKLQYIMGKVDDRAHSTPEERVAKYTACCNIKNPNVIE